MQNETDLDATTNANWTDSRAIAGGSGGGGGDGASPIGGGMGGAAGAPGGGQNGQNGLNEFVAPGRTIFGGGGGAAGGDGSAEVDAITAGISELNPDLQAILNWGFLHNQTTDVTLRGSGAGGGGGGGGDFVDMPLMLFFGGGGGGEGGAGQDATINVSNMQATGVNTTATLVGPPGGNTTARVTANIGWVGSELGDNLGQWQRNVNIAVTIGNATLLIAGGPNGPITAFGMDSNGNLYENTSLMFLQDPTGSFGIGFDDFVTDVSTGETATLMADCESTFVSNTRAFGGFFGGGGGDGAQFAAGANGAGGPGPFTGGGTCGAGGAGGMGDFAAGGSGGDGEDGEEISGIEAGMFQGDIDIIVDQP